LNKTLDNKALIITTLLNGMFQSVNNLVPLVMKISPPQLCKESVGINFGVLIGITGDVKGKLILSGPLPIFSTIGKEMFGMDIEGEMLVSFSGELGNMIAAALSSDIVAKGIKTDITSPAIIQGNTSLSGFNQAFRVPITFDNYEEMEIYLFVD
jgi:chemotaxis protein CheX